MSVKNASFAAETVKTAGRFVIIDGKNSENHPAKCEQLKYSLIWLRDNCQCPNCFHQQTKSRTIDWTKFDLKDAQPKTVSVKFHD